MQIKFHGQLSWARKKAHNLNVWSFSDSLSEVDEDFHPETLVKFDDIFPISTMFNQNTEAMKQRLRKLLDIYIDLEEDDLQREKGVDRDLNKDDSFGRKHNKGILV